MPQKSYCSNALSSKIFFAKWMLYCFIFRLFKNSLERTPVNCYLIGKPHFKFTYLVCINSFFHIGNTVSQKNWKKCGKFRRKRKIKRTLFLQTLEIRKKLLQIYCYQNFCSNALTVTLFKSYCSNSNFVKKLLKSYCSNLLLQ